MKKIFYSMFALFMALSFASCEDVPAPYDDPANSGDEQLEEGIYIKEGFTANKGDFEIVTVKGKGWAIDHSVMTASGFNFEDKTTIESESYLVSPVMNLSNTEAAFISFKYIYMYGTPEAKNQVFITNNYTGDPTTTEWTDLSIKWQDAEIKDFDTYYDYSMNIPAEFIGKDKVVLAFSFKCSSKKTSTFKIKDLLVKDGKAEAGDNDKPEVEDGVRNLPYSESFSSNFGGFKSYTTSGAGEWIIDFNTAKATGYDFANKTNTAGTYYLVSPEISLAGQKEVHFTYEYIQAYANKLPNGNKLFITDNFNAENAAQNWTEIPVKHKEPNKNDEGKIDWKNFHKMDVQVPAKFLGKNIRIAFYHECNKQASTTMEIKNFLIEAGKAQGGDVTPDPEPQPEGGALVEESFQSSFGVFTEKTIKGQPWIIDFKTAKASGYDNASQTTTASDSYLVSPAMDMSALKDANVKFEYILRYVSFNGNPTPGVVNELLITNEYTGDPATTKWTNITGTLKEGETWTTFEKFGVNIPAEFIGKNKIVIALHYACEEKSGTWEVKNLKVSEGKVEEGGNDNPGGGNDDNTGGNPDDGDITTSNGDFETWVGGKPNNWNGPASKATITQSTDAHSGKYSVKVGGDSKYNKRLGYKSLNLKAGHYVMKFFVKAASSNGAAARPGYVVLKDGKPESASAYIYGNYINDLTTDKWTEATYDFDIDADGEFTVVVMNAKNPGKDILVDDFTLECNGEFIIK